MTILTRPLCSQIDERIHTHEKYQLKSGDLFPNIVLTKSKDGKRENFSTQAELADRKVVIFTVPCAFTPTCTTKHLAGFKESVSKILELGIDKIICIAPNELDVVLAWNSFHGDPAIEMWADNLREVTDATGLGLNLSGDRALNHAMKRSAIVVSNRQVQWIKIEDSAANCGVSHAASVIDYLKREKL